MPIYEYLCRKCGHRFERIQQFSDPLITECPQCGAEVDQVLTAPSVRFKGSGWYATDYAGKSGSGEKKEEGAAGKREEKSASKKDEKPASQPSDRGPKSEKKD